MMDKRVSFLILSNTGSSLKQLTFSRTVLRGLSVLFTAGLVLAAYASYDYYGLRKTAGDNGRLQAIIAQQKDEIVDQRRQIQNFAHEVTDLKSELVALNDFERKIRIIANLEKTAEQDSLFGVGGSIPDDLDAKVPLTAKHNSLIRAIHKQTRQLDMASNRQKEGFESCPSE